MEALQGIIQKLGLETTFETMGPREYEQFKVDGLNNTVGHRNEEDGYDCHICKNKGYVVKLEEKADGSFFQVCSDCRCVETRRSIMRMKRSGLKNIIKDYTFDKFTDTEPWQKALKKAAVEYAGAPDGWFFIGGQSGAGKTHLCTAICREFLLEGRQVVYMLWRDEIVKLKGLVNEAEEYGKLIDKYKQAEVLYIDDLFKTGKGPDGGIQRPTGADVNVAFEIINYRSNDPALLTIISSECTEDDLLDIDEAVGGRIIEKAKAFSIAKDRKRNYRLKKAVTL
jgi:DNA replication protein DnaC